MSREAALLGLLADLATDRDALIEQRNSLKAALDAAQGEIDRIKFNVAEGRGWDVNGECHDTDLGTAHAPGCNGLCTTRPC